MIFRVVLSLIFLSPLSSYSLAAFNLDSDSGYYAEELGASEGNDLIIWKEAGSSIIDSFSDEPWLDVIEFSDVFEIKGSVVLLMKSYGSMSKYQLYPSSSQVQVDTLGSVAVRFPVEAYGADSGGVTIRISRKCG